MGELLLFTVDSMLQKGVSISVLRKAIIFHYRIVFRLFQLSIFLAM